MDKSLTPDKEVARSFLNKLDNLEDIFTFQTFDDKKDENNFIYPCVKHGTFDEHYELLKKLNQKGAGIFVMVNRGDGITHEGEKTCRTKSNVIAVRALFADADGVPIEPILDICPPPHILVESSPGKWHIYWLTNDTKLEEFTPMQEAIAERYGTDPAVKDLPRVMRIPGFYHQKNEPFMTRLVTN